VANVAVVDTGGRRRREECVEPTIAGPCGRREPSRSGGIIFRHQRQRLAAVLEGEGGTKTSDRDPRLWDLFFPDFAGRGTFPDLERLRAESRNVMGRWNLRSARLAGRASRSADQRAFSGQLIAQGKEVHEGDADEGTTVEVERLVVTSVLGVVALLEHTVLEHRSDGPSSSPDL